MKIINGSPFFRNQDLKIFLGHANDYSVAKLITEGYLTPIQTVSKGAKLFDPREVLILRVTDGKSGPIIPAHRQVYMSILASLKKGGYDVSYVIPDERGVVESSPIAQSAYREMFFTKDLPSKSPQPQASLKSILSEGFPPPPVADVLPFEFNLGNPDAPLFNITSEDISNVSGCFGYADETNTECTDKCHLRDRCFALRLDMMILFAESLESGQDPKVSVSTLRDTAIKEITNCLD